MNNDTALILAAVAVAYLYLQSQERQRLAELEAARSRAALPADTRPGGNVLADEVGRAVGAGLGELFEGWFGNDPAPAAESSLYRGTSYAV